MWITEDRKNTMAEIEKGSRVAWKPDPELKGTVKQLSGTIAEVHWDAGGYTINWLSDLDLISEPVDDA